MQVSIIDSLLSGVFWGHAIVPRHRAVRWYMDGGRDASRLYHLPAPIPRPAHPCAVLQAPPCARG